MGKPITTDSLNKKAIIAQGRRDLQLNSLAITAIPYRAKVVGISAKALTLISFLALMAFGYTLYLANQEMKAKIAELDQKSQKMERMVAQKDEVIAARDKTIAKFHDGEVAGQASPVQVINNINVPAEKKTTESAQIEFETQWDRWIYTESLIKPRLPKRQLPLSAYIDEVDPAMARDYKDLLLQISVQTNRFRRHQDADYRTFAEFNRKYNGYDSAPRDKFREKQIAQRYELERIFDKVQDSYREQKRRIRLLSRN